MEHYTLDVHPIPKEKMPLYINEPWLIDSLWKEYLRQTEQYAVAD